MASVHGGPGRAPISKNQVLQRVEWKELLRRVESRLPVGRISSARYAEGFRKFFPGAGGLSPGTVNHYRNIKLSLEKVVATDEKDLRGRDYRVPQDEEVALCLAWTLDELGAWDDVAKSDAEEERNRLLSLLGFTYVPSKEHPLSARSEREDAAAFLYRAARESRDAKESDRPTRFLVEIDSALSFHAASGGGANFADALRECLAEGVFLLYVIQEVFPERVPKHSEFKGRLSTTSVLQRRLLDLIDEVAADTSPQKRAARTRDLKNLVYVLYEPRPFLPHYQDAFARVGILYRTDECASGVVEDEQGRLDLNHFRAFKPERYIVERCRSISSDRMDVSQSGWDPFPADDDHPYKEIVKLRHEALQLAESMGYSMVGLFDSRLATDVHSVETIRRLLSQMEKAMLIRLLEESEHCTKQCVEETIEILKD